MYPHSHELSTITALSRSNICVPKPASGTYNGPSTITPVRDSTMNGRKSNVEKSVFRKSTAITELSLSDTFLKKS